VPLRELRVDEASPEDVREAGVDIRPRLDTAVLPDLLQDQAAVPHGVCAANLDVRLRHLGVVEEEVGCARGVVMSAL
jgi:hypothetical protein